MKVVCAWCQEEGRGAVLGEKEPDDDTVTHGICDDHAVRLLADVRAALARGSTEGRGA